MSKLNGEGAETIWSGPLVARLALHPGRCLAVWVGCVGLESIPIAAFVCRAYRGRFQKPFNRVDFGTHPLVRKKGQANLVNERTVINYLIDLGIPLSIALDAVNKVLESGGWPSLPKDYLIAKEDVIENGKESDNG